MASRPTRIFSRRYALREEQTGELMTKALNFTYVELPKFTKTEGELANLEDKFYFCLAHMGRLGERPGNLDGEIFRKLFEVAEFAKMDHAQQRQYLAKMTTERDIKNQIAYARNEGLAEGEARGKAEGKAEGLAEGEAKGKAEGLAEGEAKGKLSIARMMKADGAEPAKIALYPGLTIEEIKNL